MIRFFKKYNKGFFVGIIVSAFIILMLIVSNASAVYSMNLKAQELSKANQTRDFLINDKTAWIFGEYKVRHQDAQYFTYIDVVTDVNEIMSKYGPK